MNTRKIAEQIVAALDWNNLNSLAPRQLADAIDASLTKAITDERDACVAVATSFRVGFAGTARTAVEEAKDNTAVGIIQAIRRRDDTADTQTEGSVNADTSGTARPKG